MNIFGYTLTFKKTVKRRKGFSSNRWTKEDTQTLLDLKNDGKSTAQIAKYLNRTSAACNARLWKIRVK